MSHRVRQRLWHLLTGASPAFVSQLTFSVVSFFSVAGLSRQATPEILAAVTAAYSFESLQISWLDARLVNFLVLRGPAQPRRGDIQYLARHAVAVAIVFSPLLAVAAYFVDDNASIALFACAWASSMCVIDLLRYAASRYLKSRTIMLIGGAHAVVSITISLLWRSGVNSYLTVLSLLSLITALLYWRVLLFGRTPGISEFWQREREFGRSLGIETASGAAATGLSGTLLAWINPALAVGLSLANQILTMPSQMLAQALNLPLSRDLRQRLDDGIYPRRMLTVWVTGSTFVPVVLFFALLPVTPLVHLLLGERAVLAYHYLPVACLQSMAFIGWLPLTMARRWVDSPRIIQRHVAITASVYYGALVLVALVGNEGVRFLGLVILASSLLLSVSIRILIWLREPRPDWNHSRTPTTD